MHTGENIPKISIIIPVYNVADYLTECIESIAVQEYKDCEIILVDDGSTDGSEKLCDEYAARDNRVKVIHQRNQGAVSARKNGLRKAEGEYVVIVDSDDYIDKSLLKRLNAIIDEYNPDIIKYSCKRFSENSGVIQSNKFKNEYFNRYNIDAVLSSVMYDKDIPGLNFGSIMYSLWSGAVRRELLIKYQMPVPDSIRMGDDLAVTVPMLFNCNSIYFADFVGYYYRSTEGSMVNSFNPEEIKLLNIIVQYLSETVPERYRNSVSVYALNMILQYFEKASQAYSKKEFKDWIKDGLSDYIYNAAVRVAVSKKSAKDFIKISLLKTKRYGVLWHLLRLKYK